uniref:phosphoribosylamine--glycine ligase n=1 Tax=Leersia perrieri TaxID=77586 RepID=A0A0D9UXB9_9ORYZ
MGSRLIVQASKRGDTSLKASVTNASLIAEERITVLVIGSGGREHALCYALNRSPSCDAVLCAPGNAGIAQSGDATCISDLDISDSVAVIAFCRKMGVGMVVVGPEAPLVTGLVNDLVKAEIPTFGPSSKAAALEGSKDFMKKLCDKYNIPTAQYRTFTDPVEAKQYVKDQGAPIVVKADGLAAGKGVVVAMSLDEAFEAIDSMLVQGSFGSAGSRVLMMRLESDLAQVLLSACRGELGDVSLTWSPEMAMVVVMASQGYPGSYKKGTVIRNINKAEQVSPAVKIFHAGTALDGDGNLVAVGGRVLGITAKGKDIEEARERAYDAVEV